MDVVTMIGVASVAGAALFFTSGYAARSIRRGRAGGDDAAGAPDLAEHGAAERAELQRLLREKEQALADARRRAVELEASLKQAQARADAAPSAPSAPTAPDELKTEIDQHLAARAQAEHELDQAKKRVATLERAQAAEQAEQAKQTKQAVQAKQTAQAKADKGAKETAGLREEVARLRQEFEQLSADATPHEEVEKLRTKQRDMLIKSQLMQQRVSEMERHATENAELRQRLTDFDELVAERERHRRELKDLQARAFAAGVKLEEKGTPAATPAAVEVDEKILGSAIEQLLGKVAARDEIDAAVLADTQGFLIAAAGERSHHEPMAVLSSLIAQLGEQSREVLPVGELTSCELVDANGAALASQLFDQAGQPLAVTLLRRAARPADPDLQRLVVSIAKVLERGGETP